MTDTRPVSLVVEMRIDIPDFSEGQFGEYGDPEGHALLLGDIITKFASNRDGFASGEVRVEGEPTREEEYVAEGGSKCPVCGNESGIKCGKFNFEMDSVYQQNECPVCDSVWTDGYTLHDVEINHDATQTD